jgi:UDP-N-acetyl-D-mannosaminuronate dehydrogenase
MTGIIVIGTGEIGGSIIKLIEEKMPDAKLFKKDLEDIEVNDSIDVCHVCIPYSEKFEAIVADYIEQYDPGITIINSTVAPGATMRIYEKTKKPIAHSPVRGRHPNLVEGLKKYVKFIGGATPLAAELAKKHLEGLGINTEVLSKAVNTEIGKLLSTSYYAVMIGWHQEMERLCREAGADFEEAATRFSETCTIDIDQKIPRPAMFPGYIGGHCLMPNIKILKDNFHSEYLDAVEHSNDKKKEELIREGKWNR